MKINLRDGLARLVETYGEYGPEVQEWRAHPRKPAGAPIPVTVERRGGQRMEGTIRDLSRGGVGLHVPATMPVGEQFSMRAEVQGRPVLLVGRVANCRRFGPGTFVVGAELVQSEAKPAQPGAAAGPQARAGDAAPAEAPVAAAGSAASMPARAPVYDEGEELLRRVAQLLGAEGCVGYAAA